jgi:hypothetical protein
MARKIFTVASLDPDDKARHFSKVDSAVDFAARQARASWSTTEWTVKVNTDLTVRIVADVTNHFEVLVNGNLVGTGYLSSKGKALANEGAWDVINRVSKAPAASQDDLEPPAGDVDWSGGRSGYARQAADHATRP